MKRVHLSCLLTVLILSFGFQLNAQARQKVYNKKNGRSIDFPWVPRISAYKSYTLYKAGKAILVHAGGEKYNRRHIVGSINAIDPRDPHAGDTSKIGIKKLPRKEVLIITYCY